MWETKYVILTFYSINIFPGKSFIIVSSFFRCTSYALVVKACLSFCFFNTKKTLHQFTIHCVLCYLLYMFIRKFNSLYFFMLAEPPYPSKSMLTIPFRNLRYAVIVYSGFCRSFFERCVCFDKVSIIVVL